MIKTKTNNPLTRAISRLILLKAMSDNLISHMNIIKITKPTLHIKKNKNKGIKERDNLLTLDYLTVRIRLLNCTWLHLLW